MSTVRLRRIWRVYRNGRYRIISSISSLQHERKISAGAPVTFPSYTARKWLPLTCFVNVLLLNFLWKRETRQGSSTSDFVLCMEMPAWMPAVSEDGWNILRTDGNTDIADQLRCGRLRTAATERNKQKVDELIREDRRITGKLQCSLEWGTMRSSRWWRFWDIGNLFPLGSPFAYRSKGTQNGWELLSHPP
jgi:hypothetical protein